MRCKGEFQPLRVLRARESLKETGVLGQRCDANQAEGAPQPPGPGAVGLGRRPALEPKLPGEVPGGGQDFHMVLQCPVAFCL